MIRVAVDRQHGQIGAGDGGGEIPPQKGRQFFCRSHQHLVRGQRPGSGELREGASIRSRGPFRQNRTESDGQIADAERESLADQGARLKQGRLLGGGGRGGGGGG